MRDLTLYDLCAEDHILTAHLLPNSNNQVRVVVETDEGIAVYAETSDMAAWDSLVYFSQQVLNYSAKIKLNLALADVEDKYFKGLKK